MPLAWIICCHISTSMDRCQIIHIPTHNPWCIPFARSDSIHVHTPSSKAAGTDCRLFSFTWSQSSLSLSGRVDFLVTRVHPAACLRCCRGEACFHLNSLFHTKREGEEWEITVLPVSVNLGHRASGGNTPGSFSLWVTLDQDCCWGSLSLPPIPTPPLPLLLYCFRILAVALHLYNFSFCIPEWSGWRSFSALLIDSNYRKRPKLTMH